MSIADLKRPNWCIGGLYLCRSFIAIPTGTTFTGSTLGIFNIGDPCIEGISCTRLLRYPTLGIGETA